MLSGNVNKEGHDKKMLCAAGETIKNKGALIKPVDNGGSKRGEADEYFSRRVYFQQD